MTAHPDGSDVYLMSASFGQERLWLLDRLGRGQSFHLSGAVRIRGPLDPRLLQAALHAVVGRHEVLRTTFEFGPDGGLLQVIHGDAQVPLAERDVRQVSPSDRMAAAETMVAEFTVAPFDLSAGPLLRACTIRLGAEDWLLTVAVHHIVADGWSIGILLPELAAHYRAAASGTSADLPALPIQYADWAAWQREAIDAAMAGHADYWREQLHGARPPDLPVRSPRQDGAALRGADVPVNLPGALLVPLRALAARERATIFMVLIAALAVALARWCDQDDLVIAAPEAGRSHVELEGLIGFFLNTLPLRIKVPPDSSFRQLLGQVREVCLGAYAHQELPFEKIVESSRPRREAGQLPLARALLALQNLPAVSWDVPGLEVEPFEIPAAQAQLELAIALFEAGDGSLRGRAVYAADLWDADDVRGLLRTWRQVLEQAAAEPDQNAMRLSLPAGSERDRLAATVSGADARPQAPSLVHELIEAAVDAAPDAPAVTGDVGSLSYAELDRAANRWAWFLREHGVGPDHLVAVCMQRSTHLIVALLAVLKAGGAYLPVDPDYPKMRTSFVLGDAQPDLVLTDSTVAASGVLDSGGGPGQGILVVLADDEATVAGLPSSRPGHGASPDNLAYAIYTSGSTGTPKGALLSHAAIANRSSQTQRDYPLGPADAMLVRTPIGFDVFGSEWIWPLIAGARAVLARPGGEHDPGYLADLIARERVSVAHFVPSTLQALLTAPDITESAASLRWPTCGGEELPADLLARLGTLVPGATLRHEYGPTETAVHVAVHAVAGGTAPRGRIPVGRPVPGVRLYVLDRNGDLVPQGVIGDLYVGGAQVARGYIGRPGLTAERFVPDPFCQGGRLYRTGDRARWLPGGDLDFIGRVDDQVKIRGQRIELGEIEAALAAYPGVDRAVVIVAGDGPSDRRLIGYLGSRDGGPALEDLRAYLRARLPAALVPEAFCVLDELPLSPHGKLDRAALPAPSTGQLHSRRSRMPPRTPAEQVLADIWADVLGHPEVGVQDDFYELGGNSLRAVSVFEQAQELGLLLPLQVMLGNHTIEQLASYTGDRQADSLNQLEGLLDS